MRSNFVNPETVQSRASPVAMTISTARRLIVGRTPGIPMHTSHTIVLGAASWYDAAQPQNILLRVSSLTVDLQTDDDFVVHALPISPVPKPK